MLNPSLPFVRRVFFAVFGSRFSGWLAALDFSLFFLPLFWAYIRCVDLIDSFVVWDLAMLIFCICDGLFLYCGP